MKLKAVLIHLASECGETTQAAVKVIQHGPLSKNPKEKPPKTNVRALEEEVGDVLALVELLTEGGLLRRDRVIARINEKLQTYRRKYA
jgi:NTP pyrophosphatase (non-canonical NTP hydrolase)